MSIVGDDHPKESNEEKVCSQLQQLPLLAST